MLAPRASGSHRSIDVDCYQAVHCFMEDAESLSLPASLESRPTQILALFGDAGFPSVPNVADKSNGASLDHLEVMDLALPIWVPACGGILKLGPDQRDISLGPHFLTAFSKSPP